ncbi:MAG: acyl-CoA thioesterase [Actinomycetota bacterium]|jgi:acyl-CoA thioester hydrolase
MRYHHKAFVRWDDLDAMGHVNNAKYLTFAQEARFEWSFVQNAEGNNRPGFLQMVVAKAEVDFLAPIFDGGIFVDVDLWVESIGNSSFSMIYEIKDEKRMYARVKTVQVAVDESVAKSRPLNDEERAFLQQYLEEKK